MQLRWVLRALSFAVVLALTVVLAGEPPAAHGTVIDGPCGDRPCDEAAPASGPCGDRPCEETAPASGPCGDRPCDETAPDEGGPCGDRPCEETAPDEGGPCGDRPCDETAPDAGDITMDGAPPPASEPGAGDDADLRIDGAGDLETASEDSGSFPTIPVAVGLAALLLGVLALVTAKRRRG